MVPSSGEYRGWHGSVSDMWHEHTVRGISRIGFQSFADTVYPDRVYLSGQYVYNGSGLIILQEHMGTGQWHTGSFGGVYGTAKALDKRGWTLKNIDYFAYYIRRVSENMRNTRYPFRFEQGERIACLKDRSISISGAELRASSLSSTPLRQVSYGKFMIADTMPDSGEVILVRGGIENRVAYDVCGSMIRNVVPLSAKAEDKDRILDLIFHSRKFFFSASDEKDVVFCIEADRENHSLILSRTHIPVDTLWAIDEGYAVATQKTALKSLSEYAQPHNRPLLNLFEPTDVYDWRRVVPAVVSSDSFVFLTGPRNEARDIQREAVRKALGTPDFALIQGPPGSGKTTVLLETIVQAIKAGKRILLVASTHVAVDTILERLESHGCIERFGINPIRIGFEERVSQKINKFRLSVAAEEECKRLLAYYRSIPVERRTPAQIRMEQLLSAPSAVEEMENVIIDSANLVCGTTIGILQAPMIRRSKKDRIPGALFDIMILDEASKTTFTEFLVPAIYCRKFIISGDTNQLTPFCEERDVEKCVGSFFKSSVYKRVCKVVFDLAQELQINRGNSYRTGRIILCSSEEEIAEILPLLDQQITGLDSLGDRICYSVIDHADLGCKDQFMLVTSNLLVVLKGCIHAVLPILPPWFEIDGIGTDADHVARKQAYQLHYPRFESDTDSWEKAIAWRLCRKFELHRAAESRTRDRYEAELERLTPKDRMISVSDREITNIPRLLKNIEYAGFSSVLELLESGFGDSNGRKRYVLADGLPKGESWSSRHTLLKYQWRMHPDIAAFSSTEFYGSRALLSDSSMRKKRQFAYPSKARMVWIDTSSAPRAVDENRFEAEKVMEKLADFLAWANGHAKETGEPWEVSLLTFYGKQKELLVRLFRELLMEPFGFTGRFSHYFSGQVNVVVATVDRYQGQEADVVFLSFVRNRSGIGFLDSQNRMNVALTRARYQLYLFGSRTTFTRKNERIPEWLSRLATNTQEETLDIRYHEVTA